MAAGTDGNVTPRDQTLADWGRPTQASPAEPGAAQVIPRRSALSSSPILPHSPVPFADGSPRGPIRFFPGGLLHQPNHAVVVAAPPVDHARQAALLVMEEEEIMPHQLHL